MSEILIFYAFSIPVEAIIPGGNQCIEPLRKEILVKRLYPGRCFWGCSELSVNGEVVWFNVMGSAFDFCVTGWTQVLSPVMISFNSVPLAVLYRRKRESRRHGCSVNCFGTNCDATFLYKILLWMIHGLSLSKCSALLQFAELTGIGSLG
jgi:hypothetical protein